MSQPDRETVYAALLTLLQNTVGTGSPAAFTTVTRRFVTVSNAQPANMPYLIQVQKAEESQTVKGMPTLHKYMVDLLIYINYGSETSVVPETALNALVTAVENALAPNPVTGWQQLGIPVSSLVVNGKIEYDDMAGTDGNWGIALIPIEIVPNY